MRIANPARRRGTTRPADPASNGLLLKLELHSDPMLLSAVRGALERLTETLGFSAAACRSITRAVDEALTNIMRHCYCGELDQPVEIYCKYLKKHSPAHKDGLEIVLRDRGPAVDPAKLRGRPLDDVRPGGLGLHLIRQSMDEVEYERIRSTNRFRMVKYFES